MKTAELRPRRAALSIAVNVGAALTAYSITGEMSFSPATVLAGTMLPRFGINERSLAATRRRAAAIAGCGTFVFNFANAVIEAKHGATMLNAIDADNVTIPAIATSIAAGGIAAVTSAYSFARKPKI